MVLFPLAFAFLFYLVAYGAHTLNPFELNWLMQRDSSVHFLGWAFYLRDPWGFPLSKIPSLMAPIGTTTVSTDALPMVAAVMKFLFGWVQEPFQYMGHWLLLCYLLQAYWGFRLVEFVTKNRIYAALGACFFVLSPVLLFRSDHKSLYAQWLLLWLFSLYFRADEKKRVPFASLLAANVLSIGLHAYLLPMVFGLTLAIYANVGLLLRSRRFLFLAGGQLLAILVAVALTMYALGFFLVSTPASWGFGIFSTDLLSFFNSMGKSSLVPKIRSGGSQHEGFAYLGLGMIVLLLVSFVLGRRAGARERPVHWHTHLRPLLVACALFFFFALSSHLTFGGNTFLKIEWFYDLFGQLPHVFRSSGRFLWPLYYLVMLLVLARVYRLLSPRHACYLVAAMVALQCADMHGWYRARDERAPRVTVDVSQLSSPFWTRLAGLGLDRMISVPPIMAGDGINCAGESFTDVNFRNLAFRALLSGMSINGGIFPRAPAVEIGKYCSGLWEILGAEDLSRTLFVTDEKHLAQLEAFFAQQKESFRCERADGFYACLPRSKAVL